MKVFKYKLLLLLFTLAATTQAQTEYREDFHEDYTLSKEAKFEISNRYGKINIENTKEDKITIDAEIIVHARSEEKARKILDEIEVQIQKDGDLVKAETEVGSISGNHISFEINYTVLMPEWLPITLVNKYGDVTIANLSGKSNLAVKYGSLTVNKMSDGNTKPLSSIDLGYCSYSHINEFNWGKVMIRYSKLGIDKGQALVVSSKYSKLDLGTFSSVVAEAGYDDLDIKKVTNLVMDNKYSDLKVDDLSKKLVIENKYGNIRINNVSKEFETIDVVSKYAGIKIGVESGASYKLDAETRYGDIDYPELKVYERIKEPTVYIIKGIQGADTTRIIKIRSDYGGVDIVQ